MFVAEGAATDVGHERRRRLTAKAEVRALVAWAQVVFGLTR